MLWVFCWLILEVRLSCVCGFDFIEVLWTGFGVEVAEVVGNFINEEVVRADKGITYSSLDGLLGGLRRSAFYFLLALKMVELFNIEVAPASLIDAADEEMFLYLGGGCLCHDQ